MAISLSGIIDRAMFIATSAGIDPHQASVIDNKYVAEVLAPHALREAVKTSAGMGSGVGGLKRTHSLTLVAGEVDLPESVLEECLEHSSVYSDDIDDLTSYEARWIDYQRLVTQYSQLNYYTTRGGKFCFTEAGNTISTSTLTVNLVAVSLPDIPTTITDAMDITADLAELCIQLLARMLKTGI